MDRFALEDLLTEARQTKRAVRIIMIPGSERALPIIVRLIRAKIVDITDETRLLSAVRANSFRPLLHMAIEVTPVAKDAPQRCAIQLWSMVASAGLVDKTK